MNSKPARETVGLIPAAGEARRLGMLPCSKELLPVGLHAADGGAVPRVACMHLLDALQRARADKAFVVLRNGKWDIPAYLQDGAAADVPLAYLMVQRPYGVPYTLDQAYPFSKEARVLAGFPDILFHPREAFVRLLDKQAAMDADIVLGLFPTDQPHRSDMVELDAEGRVQAILVKPPQTDLRYAWIIAVWMPSFTRFLHDYARGMLKEHGARFEAGQRELFLGEVIQAALEAGLHVAAESFPDGRYLDIGTPENLARALCGTW